MWSSTDLLRLTRRGNHRILACHNLPFALGLLDPGLRVAPAVLSGALTLLHCPSRVPSYNTYRSMAVNPNLPITILHVSYHRGCVTGVLDDLSATKGCAICGAVKIGGYRSD